MSPLLFARWSTEEGKKYKKLIVENCHDREKLNFLAGKYFGFSDDYLDYRYICLSGVKFNDAKFDYCDFSCSQFDNVEFNNSVFTCSCFDMASLKKIQIKQSSFSGAMLNKSNLESVGIINTSFGSVSAREANLCNVKIFNGDFMSVDFAEANLNKVLFLGDVWLKSAILPLAAKKEIELQIEDCRNLERIKWV